MIREDKGLSRMSFAKSLGMNRVRYGNIERGVIVPLPDEQKRIAQKLKVKVNDIF